MKLFRALRSPAGRACVPTEAKESHISKLQVERGEWINCSRIPVQPSQVPRMK